MFTRTINGKIYFAYSFHRTRERANDALESYFASGEICDAERPEIVATTDRNLRASKAHFAVMFPT